MPPARSRPFPAGRAPPPLGDLKRCPACTIGRAPKRRKSRGTTALPNDHPDMRPHFYAVLDGAQASPGVGPGQSAAPPPAPESGHDAAQHPRVALADEIQQRNVDKARLLHHLPDLSVGIGLPAGRDQEHV